MKNMDQFIGSNFSWFIGEVKDINDPLLSNRVKVLPYGYYDETIEAKHLPWSTVMMPNTSSSYKGFGSNHELMVGSWIVGFFRDGPSAQDAVILGSIASSTESIIDIPLEAQLNPPTNKVHKTEAGHIIEIDNTSGAERIHIKHTSGTYILMKPTGDIEHSNKNHTKITTGDDTVTITGNSNVTINGDCNLSVSGNYKADVTGNIDLNAGGNVNITGARIDLN
jgi:hypothetical protein|tara:strand:- start:194 stop:862 length:669 start_codon:yes stop_codon:yes gene_type:complete